ncbi:MAG TPA: response regulator transcription factor [Saprospiraceae bacterium]|nr:response regulator transcription factor [Saprospiraceae bacterium]HPN69101.1 response regulator transcription factor [Saprospiraceae bacterium]
MAKILYVEDELFLAKIVKESLETRSFEIIHASDGIEGYQLFLALQPDICVLDIMMPNLDGLSLAKKIRAVNSKIPIIFVTAKNQSADVVEGFAIGGNDFIKKPFSMEELIVRIQNLLKLTGNALANENFKKLGDFEYYSDKMVITNKEITYQLSHKENEILKVLTTKQNQKIERAELLNHVWGNDSFFNSRTLDVYIRKLRSILETDENIKILTLRGVGYTFYNAKERYS